METPREPLRPVEVSMNPVRRSTLLAILLLLVPSVSAGADRVDGFIRAEMNARHIPGLSLCVVKDGHVIKAEGYGLANLELEVPATPSTAYEIGSMTKQFTAAAIMILVEEGKVSLDKPITAYLPELPTTWRGVKVRHVLTHTSGIEDHVALSDTETERYKRYTQPQMIALVASAPLEFPPGSKWSYSNTGYFILGMMIERVSGETYGAFLQHRIFSPLGMSATRLYDLIEIIPHRAAGYVLHDGHFVNAQPVDPTHPWASGGLLSSSADLAKWDAALYTERILRASSIKQILTSVILNDGEPARDTFWHRHY